MEGGAGRESRAAENQSLFREVNEQIARLRTMFDGAAACLSWTCECAGLDCLERIEMTIAEYERMRRNPARFAVAPADHHVFPDVERVVETHERYWVVEKERVAADVAAELAPR
jgi:hypothetical protein